jgi:hypothetical protein
MFSDVLLQHTRDVKRGSFLIANRRAVIISNLVFVHDSSVAIYRLLIEAAESTDLLPRSPFHERLAEYYRSHADEERDHAQWFREDLESVGRAPAELPDQLAMGMAGSQYYLLKHAHPVALLGYMAVLEGDPTPIEVVQSLEHAYGEQLLRCVRYHAVNDLEHRKELFAVIDDTPESLRGLIAYSADNTLDYIIQAARTWAGAGREPRLVEKEQ